MTPKLQFNRQCSRSTWTMFLDRQFHFQGVLKVKPPWNQGLDSMIPRAPLPHRILHEHLLMPLQKLHTYTGWLHISWKQFFKPDKDSYNEKCWNSDVSVWIDNCIASTQNTKTLAENFLSTGGMKNVWIRFNSHILHCSVWISNLHFTAMMHSFLITT